MAKGAEERARLLSPRSRGRSCPAAAGPPGAIHPPAA